MHRLPLNTHFLMQLMLLMQLLLTHPRNWFKKKRPWRRGGTVTAAKRAAQFLDGTIPQGNDMLCKWCWAVVQWGEPWYAWSCAWFGFAAQHSLHP